MKLHLIEKVQLKTKLRDFITDFSKLHYFAAKLRDPIF